MVLTEWVECLVLIEGGVFGIDREGGVFGIDREGGVFGIDREGGVWY